MDGKIAFLQASVKIRETARQIEPTRTFADLLYNVGFSNADEQEVMASAWYEMYKHVRPDIILFDHSPTGLLAAHASPACRAFVGSGFFFPPDMAPFPILRKLESRDIDDARKAGRFVLKNANRVLERYKSEPLERLSELYARVDEAVLVKFAEVS